METLLKKFLTSTDDNNIHETVRNFWTKNYSNALEADSVDLIEKLIQEFNSDEKYKQDVLNDVKNYLSVEIRHDRHNKVGLMNYLDFFDEFDLVSRISNLIESMDEKNNVNNVDNITKMNENCFSTSHEQAKMFWMDQIEIIKDGEPKLDKNPLQDKLYVEWDKFFNQFKEFIVTYEGKLNTGCSSTNDFNKLEIELKKILVKGTKVKSTKFAEEFKDSITTVVQGIMRKNDEEVESTKVFTELNWDKNFNGQNTCSAKKSFVAYGSNYHCVVSEQTFETGIHYIEFHIDKTDDNLYLGVAFEGKFNPDSCPRNSDSVWAIGPIISSNPSESSIEMLFKEGISEVKDCLTEGKFIGMVLNFEENDLKEKHFEFIRFIDGEKEKKPFLKLKKKRS